MSDRPPAPAWDCRSHGEVVVCATGAYNGLGFNSHQTWAFWRAEAAGRTESPFRAANGERASFVSARGLPIDLTGPKRLWPLLKEALEEVAPALARFQGA